MKQVAKIILIEPGGTYLLMTRSNHRKFPYDPDLPGGTMEEGEEPLAGMQREVLEEAGVSIEVKNIEHIHSTTEYSPFGATYHLYTARLENQPSIILSWEHSDYKWLDEGAFLKEVKKAKDPYMHMVYDAVFS